MSKIYEEKEFEEIVKNQEDKIQAIQSKELGFGVMFAVKFE